MSASAERQRKCRERLRRKGIVDVTVPIPKVHKGALRQFAQDLRNGTPVQIGAGPLFEVIKALKSARPQLEEAGIMHAGVFGSTARGEYRLHSDIDILLDVDTKRVSDIVTYIKIVNSIKDVVKARCPEVEVEVEVDVANQATLKPQIRLTTQSNASTTFSKMSGASAAIRMGCKMPVS